MMGSTLFAALCAMEKRPVQTNEPAVTKAEIAEREKVEWSKQDCHLTHADTEGYIGTPHPDEAALGIKFNQVNRVYIPNEPTKEGAD